MRCIWIFLILTIGACTSSDDPISEDDRSRNTDDLWRSNSIEFELQFARELSAFDIGPFIDYDRRFNADGLPEDILRLIKSLDVSLPPESFPLCGAVLNPETYIVRVSDSNGDERTYMDEVACNLGVIGGLPKPEQVVGVLVQNQLHELRNRLLEYDPMVFNP